MKIMLFRPLDQEKVELEMTWTDWQTSCRDAHVTPTGSLRQCRRLRGHDDDHASGFGLAFETWS